MLPCCIAIFRHGLAALQTFYQQNYFIPDVNFEVANYTSPLLHHVLLANLPESSTIYYQVRASCLHTLNCHLHVNVRLLSDEIIRMCICHCSCNAAVTSPLL